MFTPHLAADGKHAAEKKMRSVWGSAATQSCRPVLSQPIYRQSPPPCDPPGPPGPTGTDLWGGETVRTGRRSAANAGTTATPTGSETINQKTHFERKQLKKDFRFFPSAGRKTRRK